MHQWCPVYRDSFVQPKTLVLIINFFSLNFTSVEIEGERVSSSQNKRTLKGGGRVGGCARKQTRVNKVGEREGVKTWDLEQTYFLNVFLTKFFDQN